MRCFSCGAFWEIPIAVISYFCTSCQKINCLPCEVKNSKILRILLIIFDIFRRLMTRIVITMMQCQFLVFELFAPDQSRLLSSLKIIFNHLRKVKENLVARVACQIHQCLKKIHQVAFNALSVMSAWLLDLIELIF